MKALVVYSSITGNTQKVAETIWKIMPTGTPIYHVAKAPPPDDYALIILGFWTIRGGPDPLSVKYMSNISGKQVILFGTLAAWPDSPHALGVRKQAEQALLGNRILGTFLCQGKLAENRLQASLNGPTRGNQTSHDRKKTFAIAGGP